MIIAELCQNHLGDKNLLFDMVAHAKKAGCSFAKVQCFFADDLAEKFQHRYDAVKRAELSPTVLRDFVLHCERLQITPMVSTYTAQHSAMLLSCGFKWIKVGSADSFKKGLLAAYKATGCRVLFSTGGVDLVDIPKFHPIDGVFHCVSLYPHSPYQANLTRMLSLKKWFPTVGFSDHTDPTHAKWNLASETAILMGAEYIERHFTLLPRDETKDGPVSVDKDQLKELCTFDKFRHKNPVAGLYSMRQGYKEKQIIKNYQGRWKYEY